MAEPKGINVAGFTRIPSPEPKGINVAEFARISSPEPKGSKVEVLATSSTVYITRLKMTHHHTKAQYNRTIRALLSLVCLLAILANPAFAQLPRPNFVVIMADDMGYSDLGCYGGEINTPNLDRLAREGVRFTQFYNTGRCCPTRASLLTGLYSHQAGIGHMTGDRGRPAYQGYLNQRCATVAEVLRAAGYTTSAV